MSRGSDSNDIESNISNKKKTRESPEPSLTKPKSRKETTISQEPGGVSKGFSGEVSMKSSERPDTKVPITAATDEKKPEKAIGPAPSIKKTLTFSYKQSNSTGSIKPEREAPKPERKEPMPDLTIIKPGSPAPKPEPRTIKPGSGVGKPDPSPPIKPATQPTETKRQNSIRPGAEETEADKWEKAEMAKINEWYEKSNEKLLSWEKKKTSKARRKLDITESELERRRIKGIRKFHKDKENIKQTAKKKRGKAEEKRKYEEFKAWEKARKIRTRLCFCLT